jgi:hypothetical protein
MLFIYNQLDSYLSFMLSDQNFTRISHVPVSVRPTSACERMWVILLAVMTISVIRGLEKMFKQSANSHCSMMLQMPRAETGYSFRCCGREIFCHVSEQELHPVQSSYLGYRLTTNTHENTSIIEVFS